MMTITVPNWLVYLVLFFICFNGLVDLVRAYYNYRIYKLKKLVIKKRIEEMVKA